LRIAIVEDEVQMQLLLKRYILRYFADRKEQCRIVVFSDGEEILHNYTANYDVIFLDIQMEYRDGLQTARDLRQLDDNVYLIFVTNLAEFAIKGYSVNALDFVLKPINYLMLQRLLERVEKLLDSREKKTILLPADDGLARVDISQIYYIETSNKGLTVFAESGDFHVRETMKNMESTLADYHFFRCNSCYLINLAYVSQVKRNIVVIASQELTISRPRHKAFLEALTKYVGGKS